VDKRDAQVVESEELKKTAMRAGTAFDAAEKEGPYFQGAVDGLLMRFEAIRTMFTGPKATA
jgi:hypothetical protein